MNDESLRLALRGLAAESAACTAGPAVEARLRDAVKARRDGGWAWWRAAAATVVLGLVGGALAVLHEKPAGPPPELRAVTPWFFSAGVPAVESGFLVSMDVPAETAARFGLAARGPVQADLIIGDDGLTRAIRFVQFKGEKR